MALLVLSTFKSVLATVSYKNWVLDVDEDPWGSHLTATFSVIDSSGSRWAVDHGAFTEPIRFFNEPEIQIRMRWAIPPPLLDGPRPTPVEECLHWIRRCLIEAETHELDEHFSVRGDRPFHPHTEEGAARRGKVIHAI